MNLVIRQLFSSYLIRLKFSRSIYKRDHQKNIGIFGHHCFFSVRVFNVQYASTVQVQWVVKGAVDVDIGANPSAEGGGEEEGVDDQAVRVVDIVDTFRLQVFPLLKQLLPPDFSRIFSEYSDGCDIFCPQEQPAFDKKQFVAFIKRYIKTLTPKLDEKQQEEFKKNIEGATKFLLSKLKDLQLYVPNFLFRLMLN